MVALVIGGLIFGLAQPVAAGSGGHERGGDAGAPVAVFASASGARSLVVGERGERVPSERESDQHSGQEDGGVAYIAPVIAPVTDPYRPPADPYGPGNRGIEYATVPGSDVVAAADGEVTFAGSVGGSLFVTVQHDDGVRTTVSYVATVRVVAGQQVLQGEILGITGPLLHVSARRGDTYFDPATLWGSGPPRVYLVPLDGGSPAGTGSTP